ncbi:MAG TPA: gephyrin-like molybdotransferase receptor GlpR, partial [Mycobacterium sp.]|nr:gephyrin-like molybdotransferase receptor GlpR [Mycobacterium sp.]
MPSIPQSLLWISLVVLWLFVLVPMLISKRDAVRRTSDVALSTRVLNSAHGIRLRRGTKPAAGHRSDPNWQPSEEQYTHPADDLDDDDADDAAPTRPTVVTVAAAVAVTEAELMHPDVSDDHIEIADGETAPLATGGTESTEAMLAAVADGVEAVLEAAVTEAVKEAEAPTADLEICTQPSDDVAAESEIDDEADLYESADDTSGLAPVEEPPTTAIPIVSRQRRYHSETAAAVSARKFRFRRRAVTTMVLIVAITAALAYSVMPALWWPFGVLAGVTLFYLGYLRRQTRIEERLRRRRMQRMARSRYGVENTQDSEFNVTPSRLRRPGSVVLEIDDEDPIYEHLDYAPAAY